MRFRSGRWRKTPYLPSSPGAADHTIAAGAAATTPAFRPDRRARPQPESCPFRFGVVSWDLSMGGTHCRHRRRQRVALPAQRGARLRLARARGKCAPLRYTPPQFSAVSIGPLAKDPLPPELTRRRRPHQRSAPIAELAPKPSTPMMEGPWCRFRREARASERHRHCSGG